ncbi:sigma-70 family RNA polymerase sigma factor [Rubritalea tangerina]|uniref:Sigma-70 family RNA polymerase sigma factor n=2 Tax=Rubritalea tangerina TaxID=430798 RepID=A0ABW4ZDM0_9BACT
MSDTDRKKEDARVDEGSLDYDRLVAVYQKPLYFYIRSMVFNPEDARDVLQDVNIILFKKQSYYVMGTNFKAWAFSVARFECLNYLKQYKRVQWDVLESELIENIADSADGRAMEVEMYGVALEACLGELSDEAQSLVEERYQNKTPLETVAERWSTSVGALKQKLMRARAKLKLCVSGRVETARSEEPSFTKPSFK